jgi:hypothetical protein
MPTIPNDADWLILCPLAHFDDLELLLTLLHQAGAFWS